MGAGSVRFSMSGAAFGGQTGVEQKNFTVPWQLAG